MNVDKKIKEQMVQEFINPFLMEMERDLEEICDFFVNPPNDCISNDEWEETNGYPKGSLDKARREFKDKLIAKLKDPKVLRRLTK